MSVNCLKKHERKLTAMATINSKEEKQHFYKTVIALVIPMALQNLINVGVQAADVLMLGKLDEAAISAASLAGQIYFIMTLLFFGLTSGAAVLTAQYWGKGDAVTIEKVLGLAMRWAVSIAAVFTAAALIFPVQLMHIFSSEADVIEQGAQYMRIVAIAYIPAAATMVYLNVMRSVERVIISTVIYTISLFVNIILNAVFIFGLCGVPALGVRGAAIATAIARYCEFFIMIFYAFKVNKIVRIKGKYLAHTEKILVSDFIKYAVPVAANELLWGSGISMITAIIGHLGKSAVAANSVVQVVRQLAMVVIFGVANATAIMLGKAIGEGKKDYAKVYSVRFIKITLLLGLGGALVVLGVSPIIKSFMSLGNQANDYLSGMMYVMSYFVIASGVNTVLIVGVFRAGGDTKFGLFLDSGTLWLMAIPLGAVAAFILKLPVIAVYVILTSDELIKLPFTFTRYKSFKWLKDVTRDTSEIHD